MITLRFVAHPGLFTSVTRIFQYGFWCSHVDAVTPNGSYLGAMILGGVRDRPADYDGGKFIKQMFVHVEATPSQEHAFYDFLHSQIGKPYDSLSLVTFLGSRDWQNPGSWFCSELQASALAECGLFPKQLAVGYNRITPRDLLLLVSAVCEVEHD